MGVECPVRILDDQRPTLTLTHPKAGANPPLERILIGMHDYGTGLDAASFDLGELTVVVDPDGAIEECDEADNTVVIADPR